MATKIEFVKDEPKKHSIRFKATTDDSPLSTVYVTRDWLRKNDNPDGAKNIIVDLSVKK